MLITLFVVLLILAVACFFRSFNSPTIYDKAFFALVGLVLIRFIFNIIGG